MPSPHPPNPGPSPPSDPPPPPLPEPSEPYRAGFRYPNPREVENPDPVTLREQWKFAVRQYSKWYSHAWGTAILAGGAFFALGWLIKGSNPLPSRTSDNAPAAQDDNKEK